MGGWDDKILAFAKPSDTEVERFQDLVAKNLLKWPQYTTNIDGLRHKLMETNAHIYMKIIYLMENE